MQPPGKSDIIKREISNLSKIEMNYNELVMKTHNLIHIKTTIKKPSLIFKIF